MHALQLYIRDKVQTKYSVVYRSFSCLLPSIRVIGLSLIGLSWVILSTNSGRIGNVYGRYWYDHGWCIVRRHTLRWKGIALGY